MQFGIKSITKLLAIDQLDTATVSKYPIYPKPICVICSLLRNQKVISFKDIISRFLRIRNFVCFHFSHRKYWTMALTEKKGH